MYGPGRALTNGQVDMLSPMYYCPVSVTSCRTLLSRFPEALVVPDLREDVRFKDSPVVVGWPHALFYAACPLVSADNVRLGTL